MASFNHNGVAITGMTCTVPKTRIDIRSYSEIFGQKTVDSFIENTGVKTIHRSREKQTASDLCFVSAKRLIREKKLNVEEIGILVFVSQTPDYVSPATSHVLHERLGLAQDCMVFDINLGCSGWIYGVNVCASLMESSNVNYAMVLFGDTSSKTISPEDGSQIMLMGDAGSATLLEKRDYSTINGVLMSDGNGFKSIIINAGAFRNINKSRDRVIWPLDGYARSDYDSYMNGTDVFGFAISRVPKMLKNYLGDNAKTVEEYDAIVLHQANLLILRQIAKRAKIPMDKVPISLDRFGNTSGTSIPLTICDKWGGDNIDIKEVSLLGCGFGVGLSWGCLDFKIKTNDIFVIEESDDYYLFGDLEHE